MYKLLWASQRLLEEGPSLAVVAITNKRNVKQYLSRAIRPETKGVMCGREERLFSGKEAKAFILPLKRPSGVGPSRQYHD